MFKMPLDISAHSLAHAIMFVYSHVFPLNTKAVQCYSCTLNVKPILQRSHNGIFGFFGRGKSQY